LVAETSTNDKSQKCVGGKFSFFRKFPEKIDLYFSFDFFLMCNKTKFQNLFWERESTFVLQTSAFWINAIWNGVQSKESTYWIAIDFKGNCTLNHFNWSFFWSQCVFWPILFRSAVTFICLNHNWPKPTEKKTHTAENGRAA
jgi:hypothetical protein